LALSGSFNTSAYGDRYLTLSWTAEQSIANNSTTINWTLTGGGGSDTRWYYSGNFKVIIDGEQVYYSANRIQLFKGTVVASGQKVIYHNSDGTRHFTASAEAGIYTVAVNCSGSGSWTLDTIARATTPTLSVTSAEMGSNITIGLPRASASFTHDLYYAFGDDGWKWIAGNVGTELLWQIPHLESVIPNNTSGILGIRVVTKSGSTTIGTKETTMTAVVPSNYLPIVSKVTVAESVTGIAEQFGAYVQNKSKLSVKIEATGIGGSTIKEYYTWFNGAVFDKAEYTTPVLASSGELRVKVKDSRDRWSEVTPIQVDVVSYDLPKIEGFSAFRCNASGNADDKGSYIAFRCKYAVSSVGGKNTADVGVYAKLDNETETEYKSIMTMSALSDDNTYMIETRTFSIDNSFDLKMTVKDWFKEESVASAIIPSGFAIIDIRADGKGISFGKTAEIAGADFGFALKMTGGEVQPILSAGTNLNNVVACGRYTGQNVATMKYLNAPISAGSFDLVVSGNGQGDGLFLKQTLSFVRKTDSVEYTRYYFSGAWGAWVISGAMGYPVLGTASVQ
jgi:hypothetical protein